MKKLIIYITAGTNGVPAQVLSEYVTFVNPETCKHPIEIVALVDKILEMIQEGKKIAITTYSDYIIKQLNICILKFFAKNVEEPYTNIKSINPDLIECYDNLLDGTFIKCNITEYGIEVNSFDSIIIEMNAAEDYLNYHE